MKDLKLSHWKRFAGWATPMVRLSTSKRCWQRPTTNTPNFHTHTPTQQNNCKNNPCTRTPPGANPHPSRCQSRSAPRSCNLIAITTVDLPPPCVAHLWKALKSTGWKVDNVLIMYTRVYTTHYQPGRGTTCPCPHLSLLLRHCTDRLGGVARRICPSSYFLYF